MPPPTSREGACQQGISEMPGQGRNPRTLGEAGGEDDTQIRDEEKKRGVSTQLRSTDHRGKHENGP